MHPCLISLPTGNQSVSPYSVLTVASLTRLLFSMKRTLHLTEDPKKYCIFNRLLTELCIFPSKMYKVMAFNEMGTSKVMK